ncbi:hypothetical protein O5O45_03445 [Hahella aquimaris]|uniref:hypothetical protein n=1 Tax=Hahella sp. HNIBRBA332 TaxID=3015983 RepID=UPI00273AC133|nr:hypothetical protein [Hahella sp. HNIBRBA332]WLQ14984.1 hypothetical protein O5O45_03445 [Hahella sp. HNIBRBA332]
MKRTWVLLGGVLVLECLQTGLLWTRTQEAKTQPVQAMAYESPPVAVTEPSPQFTSDVHALELQIAKLGQLLSQHREFTAPAATVTQSLSDNGSTVQEERPVLTYDENFQRGLSVVEGAVSAGAWGQEDNRRMFELKRTLTPAQYDALVDEISTAINQGALTMQAPPIL